MTKPVQFYAVLTDYRIEPVVNVIRSRWYGSNTAGAISDILARFDDLPKAQRAVAVARDIQLVHDKEIDRLTGEIRQLRASRNSKMVRALVTHADLAASLRRTDI